MRKDYVPLIFRVETHFIKRSHPLFPFCNDICFRSKNLYNYANFLIRQALFHLGERLSYLDLQFQVKGHSSYKALPAQTAQQTLIQLEYNWSAFFNAMKEWKVNPSRFLGCPRPPKYKAKEGRAFAYFTNQQCKIKEGHIRFPKTQLYLRTKIDNTLKEVRVLPEGNCYKVEVVYTRNIPEVPLIPSRIAAIDVGVNNLATVANNAGVPPIVINGKVLKSINQWYNKERARLQSIKDMQGYARETKKMREISTRRNHKVHDLLHKASHHIINYCQVNRIDTVVIGWNLGWKQGANLGRRNNQTFVQIPLARFIQMVQYKGNEAGISVVTTGEAYTSKCSAWDNESIEQHDTYRGKRITRGLFRASDGTLINADLNGAYNILRKAFPNAFDAEGMRGCALHPARITLT